MSPDQSNDAFDSEPKSDMNVEEESDDDDDEETSKSSGNPKTDKMRRISHSEIERRRREKMNRFIDEIAQLLPIDPVKKLDKLTVLRVAVDTVKYLKGASSKVPTSGFGKQIYLDDNELLELTLASIAELDRYFFLVIECQKGRICYASSSVETILGSKPIDLCLQTIFDILYPGDMDIVRHQLINEKKTSTSDTEDSPTDSKCISAFTTRQNCLELGNRRTFSCRLISRKKRTTRTATTTLTNNYLTIDFVGYIKQYSLTNDDHSEVQYRPECRPAHIATLTPSDVWNAIGTNPTSCLLTMGHVVKQLEKSGQSHDNITSIDRMFLFKLNSDGQFTYFDRIEQLSECCLVCALKNKQCYPLLGYLSQDLLGMTLKDFIHDDDRNKILEIWNRVCRDRQIVTSDNYRFRTKDNIYIIVQTIFEPFINPWSDELEIIVARNKTKMKSVRTSSSVSSKNDNPRSVDVNSPSITDSTELIRQLLP